MKQSETRGAAVRCGLALAAVLLACPLGVQAADYPSRPYDITEPRQPCNDYDPQRQAFFGDTHVHSAYSYDAVVFGTRNKPADTYRFARGERVGMPPYNSAGEPARYHQLRRPLDFAIVTDHAETMSLGPICVTPGAAGYHHWQCYLLRWSSWLPNAVPLYLLVQLIRRDGEYSVICGKDGINCKLQAPQVWRDITQSAENAYDRSADCEFTTFIGYEWTSAPQGNNMHRNVIFRNRSLGKLSKPPPSSIDLSAPEALFEALDRDCLQQPECDVLTIPHNSNVSGGMLFPLAEDFQSSPEQARRQAQLERLIEVTQHKGDSECWYGIGASDELCAFETLPYKDFRELFRGANSDDYVPPEPVKPSNGFVRTTLSEGLRHQQRLGVNPWRFGLIGSTDAHSGLAGAVAEDNFKGHTGGLSRGDGLPDALPFNPGGLAAVWARENTRDSLFDAMRRREVFGTSGPRMTLRFFGGWRYPNGLCKSSNFVSRGYRQGVPMGSELPPRPKSLSGGPRFAVMATRDLGVQAFPGTLLQRVQIIKGWLDEATGERREQLYEVAGTPDNGASVDDATCERNGPGSNRLCAVWEDPDYQAGQSAWYYARAVENPSCRWHSYVCNANGVDCEDPDSANTRSYEACCSDAYPRSQQERAWSSPIWVGAETD